MSDSHEWCRDVRRDEAIRAAEDAAAVPSIQHRDLPEIVAELRERVGNIEALVGKAAVAGVFDGVGVPPSPATRTGETTAKHPVPPAEGLRTKRVTLEVRWNPDREPWSRVAEWLQAALLSEWFGAPGESVRVVDEADAASDEAVAHGATLSALAEARESLAAANRGIARLTAERDAAKEECERLRQSARGETLDNVRLRQQTHDLRARVAELEAAATLAPAANASVEKQEPVAWGVRRSDGTWWRDCRATRGEMLSVVTGGGDANNVVSPLYAGPLRGWLTAEEREAVKWLSELDKPQYLDVPRKHARVAQALLARSTPPRVKVPSQPAEFTLRAWNLCVSSWIAAIRAAGGEVEG